MGSAAELTGQRILDEAKRISGEVETRGEEIEAARTLPAEIVERLRDAGIFRLCLPASLGGVEAHPLETLETIETLARGDASVAWVTMVSCTTALLAASLPDAWARKIYDRPGVVTNGVTAPMGIATRAEGGVRLSGRWQWGSGCQHADWIVMGARVQQADGSPVLEADGRPRSQLCFVPRDEVDILDTWYVSGISGSGSTDFEVHDVFVPEGRWVRLGLDLPRIDTPLYRFPVLGFLGLGVASVSLGLARRAIDELTRLAAAKTPAGSRRTLAQRPHIQREVAIAEAQLGSARAFVREAVREAWKAADGADAMPVDARRKLRLATTHASMAATSVVDAMYNAGGGTSVYRRCALQRIFRDAHVATQHIMVAPPTLELVGRLFLGLETDTSSL